MEMIKAAEQLTCLDDLQEWFEETGKKKLIRKANGNDAWISPTLGDCQTIMITYGRERAGVIPTIRIDIKFPITEEEIFKNLEDHIKSKDKRRRKTACE